MASFLDGYSQRTSLQEQAGSLVRSSSLNKRKTQPRQLLSCTKCRERKVKCDRTKPCSACCARGHPKECQFIVGEGNDYSPIQQSYEIRKLRLEVQRLRERLQAARLNASGDDTEDEDSPDLPTSKTSARAAAARQRRFRTTDRAENLYFGTPGLANIISDFANLQVGNHSLTHTMPKARDMYHMDTSAYPFPILSFGDNPTSLLSILPEKSELFRYLDMFQHRAPATSFPHVPAEQITKKEVDRFLSAAMQNADFHPDMLALIFAALATGVQVGVWDRCGGQWLEGEVRAATEKANVYLAASMQALRLASFMSQPTLLCIQALLLMGPFLTNSGRFLDAWTLFGTTIRLAHSIGLHRNPKYLDPTPPLRECTTRQTLWWWMLHIDQHYSVTLGRPLGISGLGDCPLPEPLTTNPTTLRLGEFVDHFTVLARQILGSDRMMSVSRIDEFTDKLMGLWDTMPEALQFNESWSRGETALPEWPLNVMSATLFVKVQSFVILLNRQRVERTLHSASGSPPAFPSAAQRCPSANPTATYHNVEKSLLHPAPIRGRALVINSSVQLLQAFLFFYHREPAVLICWTLGQQAFNACMILILDAWETNSERNEWLVNQAYVVLAELNRCGVHSLASLAVKRISDGLAQLSARRREAETAHVQSTSRPSSSHRTVESLRPPTLTLDTSSMTDLSADTVMGNTGMFLLEDGNLQTYQPSAFHPVSWNMAGGNASASSANPSDPSRPPSPVISSSSVAVSNVTVAPFPVMSPSYVMSTMPSTGSPYPIGFQPRMPTTHQYQVPVGSGVAPRGRAPSKPERGPTAEDATFTPINPHAMHPLPVQQPEFIHQEAQPPYPDHTGHAAVSANAAAAHYRRAQHSGEQHRHQQRRSRHRP